MTSGDHDRLGPESGDAWLAFRQERRESARDAWSSKLDEARKEMDLAIETLGSVDSAIHAQRAAQLTAQFQEALAAFNEELDL